MTSREPGCGGRPALASFFVLVALLAIGPAVAGASAVGHPAVTGASSGGYVAAGETPAASDVDGPTHVAAGDGPIAADANPATTDDSPFVRAYGEASEPDLPTSVAVHSVAEGDGPIVEAGGELDLAADDASLATGTLDPGADRRPAGSVREATMDAGPASAPGTAPADPEGSLRPADAAEDPSTASGDRYPVPGIGALAEGMTVPLAPLAGNAAEFGLGSLFGGLVAVVALRRRGDASTPGPDGPAGSPTLDGPAESPAADDPAESSDPDRPAESPAADDPAGSSDPDRPDGSPGSDRPDGSGRPDPAGEADPAGETDATTAGDPLGATATPLDAGGERTETGPPRFETEPGLIPDDRLVERLLARHEGRLKQSAIVDRTGWSKSKVSRLLTRMADDGRVVKVQVGRENVIYLDGAEPRVVSDSPDG